MTKTRRLHVQAPRTAPGRAACAAQAAATLAVAALLLFAGAARAESIGVQGATSADVVLERTSTAASAMGKVSFDGRDAADNAETYAAMQADLEDATNGSEDARLVFKHMVDGAPRESLKLEPEGATVQGETVSIDTDLIPNGDFSDGGTGWSGGTDSCGTYFVCSWSYANGNARLKVECDTADPNYETFYNTYSGTYNQMVLSGPTASVSASTTYRLTWEDSGGDFYVGHDSPYYYSGETHTYTYSNSFYPYFTIFIYLPEPSAPPPPQADPNEPVWKDEKGQPVKMSINETLYLTIDDVRLDEVTPSRNPALQVLGRTALLDMLKVEAEDNAAGVDGGFAAIFANDGNSPYARGIKIQAGRDDASGDNRMIAFHDGNGTVEGYVTLDDGTLEIEQASDENLKEDIQDTARDALRMIRALPVRDWRYRESAAVQTGFVAQELLAQYPEAVGRTVVPVEEAPPGLVPEASLRGEDAPTTVEMFTIKPLKLIPILWKALSDQQVEIEDQSDALSAVSLQIEKAETKIAKLAAAPKAPALSEFLAGAASPENAAALARALCAALRADDAAAAELRDLLLAAGPGPILLGADLKTTGALLLVASPGGSQASVLPPPPGQARIWAEDVEGVTELRVATPSGEILTLNPNLAPDSAWTRTSANPFLGERMEVDVLGAVRALEALTGERYVRETPLPAAETRDLADWRAEHAVGAALEKSGWVEARLAEAWIEVPETETVQEQRRVTRHRINWETMKMDPVQVLETVEVERPTGRTVRRLRPGWRFDEVAGKIYRPRTPGDVSPEEAAAALPYPDGVSPAVEEQAPKDSAPRRMPD